MKFFVQGIPVPKGSAKAFVIKTKATGKLRAIVTQDNREKQKPWASMIGVTAQQLNQPMIDGPVSLSLAFILPRPKNHFGTGKNAAVLKASAPRWHVSKPDLDKLTRCVKDALTGVIWHDDSQVAQLGNVSKTYGDVPGVLIGIWPLETNKCGA
jgi:Holliday junction resolvase RusA-like endonuclease